jgi:hypothetical protein
VAGDERFWTRRLRWRLRGAWMWPAFAILTVADGIVLHKLPPTGFRIGDVVLGTILALFGNLFFVGVVGPFIARRLIERDRAGGRERFPPEVYLDRTAVALLLVGFVGLLVAGLGNHKVVLAETRAKDEAARRALAFVESHGDAEVRRNAEFANTDQLGDHDFRVCVPRDDARVQYCMFIDTKANSTRYDPSTLPNRRLGRAGP